MTTNTIGGRIRFIRQSNALSPVRFAKKIGVDWRLVLQWENNKVVPEMSILLNVEELFNVSVDWLINGENIAVCMMF